MNKQLLKIRCLTNMHVGNGDIDFDIIDGQVEKDPVTGYPVIFGSGVKGALREYAEFYLQEADIEDIFGVDRRDNEKKMGKAGSVKFLTAQMVAMPMRASKGKKSYYMVTAKNMLMRFCQMLCDIEGTAKGLSDDIDQLDYEKSYYLEKEGQNIGVEGHEAELEIPQKLGILRKFLQNTFSENVIILSEEKMKKHSLPVVARNHLENGKSKNLWYEEIVPHESLLFTYVLSNGTPLGDTSLDTLLKVIEENPLIQFGGNMTIGNGLTKVERWDFYE